MTLSILDLEKLPVGAKYSSVEGRSSLEVEKQDDETILVSANCDSLTLLVEELRTEIYHLQKEAHDKQETIDIVREIIIKEPTSFQWFEIWAFRILLIIGIIYFTFKKINLWKLIKRLLK